MASDEKLVKPKPANFYTVPEQPPMYFVNSWGLEINDSDATVKCGVIFKTTEEEQVVRHLCSLIFSHDGFIKFIDSFTDVATKLRAAYGDKRPSLVAQSPENLAVLRASSLKSNQDTE